MQFLERAQGRRSPFVLLQCRRNSSMVVVMAETGHRGFPKTATLLSSLKWAAAVQVLFIQKEYGGSWTDMCAKVPYWATKRKDSFNPPRIV